MCKTPGKSLQGCKWNKLLLYGMCNKILNLVTGTILLVFSQTVRRHLKPWTPLNSIQGWCGTVSSWFLVQTDSLSLLGRLNMVTPCWVLGHSGNEKADAVSDQATASKLVNLQLYCDIPRSSVKHKIGLWNLSEHDKRWRQIQSYGWVDWLSLDPQE